MKPDLATSPPSILGNLEAAVAAIIKTPVAGPRAAAAAATNNLISGTSSLGTHSNGIVRQWHLCWCDKSSHQGWEGQQMDYCDDHDSKP